MAAKRSRSRKRSGANYSSKPPDQPTFFLDRSLGKNKIANALRRTGSEVRVHDDHFPPNARDEDWLEVVGRERWVVLTKDRRIRYRNLERRALMQAGVAAFILTAGDLTGEEMAGVFVAALPTMKRFLAMHDPPFIAAITRGGRASLILDSSNRLKGRDE